MRKLSLPPWVVLHGILSILGPGALAGQGQEQAAAIRHRNDCRLAAQVLRTGNPRLREEWARSLITSCSAEGPAFFADQWRSTSPDAPELHDLVRRSAEWRDRRIYSAVREAASDPDRRTEERIGAMLVLLRYAVPSEALWFGDLDAPHDSVERVPLLTASSTGFVHVAGAEPIHEPVQPEILALLEEIALREQTRDRRVWYAAAALARVVRFEIEAGR